MDAKEVLKQMYVHFDKTSDDLNGSVPNRKPFLGISSPNLRMISKEIIKIDPIQFLDTNDLSIFELEVLHTYVIGSIKDIGLALKYFTAFSPLAKEWAVVDSLCQKFVIAKKYPDLVWNLMVQYASIDDEYMQRIVAVMLLSHYLNDAYIDQSIELLAQLKHEGYFCKMAVAWAFATIMAHYPQKCYAYLKQQKLDKWTHNKAIQKMIESFRVSNLDKARLRQMKR